MADKAGKPLQLTSDRGPRYELTADVIRQRDGDKQRELALADIVRVRAGRLGEMGTLELIAKSGAKLLVISDTKARGPSAQRYREFVEELHRRLVRCGNPVEYMGGLQIAPAIGALVAAVMIALAAVNPMNYAAGKLTVIYVVGALCLLSSFMMVIQNRKRFYDPLAIPRHLLP